MDLTSQIEAPCPALAGLKRDLRFAPTSCGVSARPVEFPEGNPIQRGELEHFQAAPQ